MINSLPAIGIGAETAVKAAEATQLVLPAGPGLNNAAAGMAEQAIGLTGDAIGGVTKMAAGIGAVALTALPVMWGLKLMFTGKTGSPLDKIIGA